MFHPDFIQTGTGESVQLLNSPQATIYFTKIRDKESNVVQTKQQLNFPPADLVDDWFLLTG